MFRALLTVETVVLVVGVSIIALFAELGIHNSVTTSADLQHSAIIYNSHDKTNETQQYEAMADG